MKIGIKAESDPFAEALGNLSKSLRDKIKTDLASINRARNIGARLANRRSGAAKGGDGRPDASPVVFGERTIEECATTGRETRGKKTAAKGS